MSRENMNRNNTQRFRAWLMQRLNSADIPGLVWEDKAQEIFRIPWKHHRTSLDGEQDAVVLLRYAVDLHKSGSGEREYSRWKNLLRNSLRSLPYIKELPELHRQDIDLPYKVYQFVDPPNRGVAAKRRRCDESFAVGTLDVSGGGHTNSDIPELWKENLDLGEYWNENMNFGDDFIEAVTTDAPSPTTSSFQDRMELSSESSTWSLSSGSQSQNETGPRPFDPQNPTTACTLEFGVVCTSPSESLGNHFLTSSQAGLFASVLDKENIGSSAVDFLASLRTAGTNEQFTSCTSNGNIPSLVPLFSWHPTNGDDSGLPNFKQLLTSRKEGWESAGASSRARKATEPISAAPQRDLEVLHGQRVEQQTAHGHNDVVSVMASVTPKQGIQRGHFFPTGTDTHHGQNSNRVFYSNANQTRASPCPAPCLAKHQTLSVKRRPQMSFTVHYSTSPILKKMIWADDFRFCLDVGGTEINDPGARQEVEDVIKLPTTDECEDLDPNIRVSKVNELLKNMARGVIISYKNNDIYAERLCKAHTRFYTPRETAPVKLPRRERKKIFSFNDHFKPQFDICQTNRKEGISCHPPQPFVYLTFGVSNIPSTEFPHSALVTVKITHLQGSDMLSEITEDVFSKSNSDNYDHIIDQMSNMYVKA